MLYAYPGTRSGECDTQTFLGFRDTNGSLNLSQTTRSSDSQQEKEKKKKICRIVDFAVPVDHRVRLKENEKKNK